MSTPSDITDKDLDFYLTVITMFCAYNQSQHFSDKMFADITANPDKTKRIMLKLAEDGYITAKPHTHLPYRFTIEITAKGVEFQKGGGYASHKKKERVKHIRHSIKKITYGAIMALLGAAIQYLFTTLTSE